MKTCKWKKLVLSFGLWALVGTGGTNKLKPKEFEVQYGNQVRSR